MAASFLKYFYSSDFDEKILFEYKKKKYSVREAKVLISSKINFIRKIQDKKIILNGEDNFNFFLNFFACVFTGKEIIISNNLKLFEKPKDYFLFEDQTSDLKDFKYEEINPEEVFIDIYTSGSSGDAKCIRKSLYNLICEAEDLSLVLDYKNVQKTISTTTFNYLFGLTFYFMFSLNNGILIDLDRINYPEDIKGEGLLFVTTPSFLEKMNKYGEKPDLPLELIVTAGSKLNDKEFDFALSISKNVTDIFGSTESGIIAYRKNPKDNLKLFKRVEIIKDDETKIKTPYSYESIHVSGDNIEIIKNNEIKLTGRLDRILKIQEKRISAEEIEKKLNNNELIKNSYCLKVQDKIGCLVVLTQDGIDFFIKNGIQKTREQIKKYLKNYFDIIPQYFKFVDEIPLNERGKADIKKAEEFFEINMSYPLIIERKVEKECADFKILFYKQCNFFKGHFEGHPILPGVVQFLFASFLIKDCFKIDTNFCNAKKIKFSSIIKPDKIVNLKITKEKNNFSFVYYNDDNKFSSGILCKGE